MGNGFQESKPGGGGTSEKVIAAVQVSDGSDLGPGGGRRNGEEMAVWLASKTGKQPQTQRRDVHGAQPQGVLGFVTSICLASPELGSYPVSGAFTQSVGSVPSVALRSWGS